jgi:hypothetical protein
VLVVCSVLLVSDVMLYNCMRYSSYRILCYGVVLISGIAISCSFRVLAFLSLVAGVMLKNNPRIRKP